MIVGNPSDRHLIDVPEKLVCHRTEKTFVFLPFLYKSGLNSYGSSLTVKVGYWVTLCAPFQATLLFVRHGLILLVASNLSSFYIGFILAFSSIWLISYKVRFNFNLLLGARMHLNSRRKKKDKGGGEMLTFSYCVSKVWWQNATCMAWSTRKDVLV